MRNQPEPVTPPRIETGQQFRLDGDPWPWTVRAITANYAALTRIEAGQTVYTVLDWRSGVRGPCNLVGQAWGDGSYSEAECAEMLAEFEAGELEVSHRNWLRIDLINVEPSDTRLSGQAGGA